VQEGEDGESKMMKRHPVWSSILFILAGALMIGVMLWVPPPFVPPPGEVAVFLGVVGSLLILWGIISLVLAVGSALWRTAKSAIAPPEDPILAFLDSVGIGQFVSQSYEVSKAEMIQLTSKKMAIERREVQERIDRLEQQGQLRYLPNGQWVIPGSRRTLDGEGPGVLGGDWNRAAQDTPIDWPTE
jgi:hypothetical protein